MPNPLREPEAMALQMHLVAIHSQDIGDLAEMEGEGLELHHSLLHADEEGAIA